MQIAPSPKLAAASKFLLGANECGAVKCKRFNSVARIVLKILHIADFLSQCLDCAFSVAKMHCGRI